mmetsp:Transcript_2198/g.3463  ORF Transcript_2198/g.3463 Transcript_2198/m.3463 type:complete len:350 (+) Transcript_2198:46-1095(+)
MNSFGEAPKKLAPGPKTRVCYVCGRQYGLHSFEIHLKQCKELWIAREAEKDPRERRPLPEDPALKLGLAMDSANDSFNGGSAGGGAYTPSAKELEEINRLSSEAYNTESLATCEYCGRSFLPEKLVIHNRSCTAGNPARKASDTVKRGNAASGAYTPGKDHGASPAMSSPAPRRPMSQSSSSRPSGGLGGGTGGGGGGSHHVRQRSGASNSNSSSEYDLPLGGTGDDPNGGISPAGAAAAATIVDDGGATNLRVANGSLVGHLGGPSGRPIRTNNNGGTGTGNGGGNRTSPAPAPVGQGGTSVFSISEFSGKEELIEYLSSKVNRMESAAVELNDSIAEMKGIIEQLRL